MAGGLSHSFQQLHLTDTGTINAASTASRKKKDIRQGVDLIDPVAISSTHATIEPDPPIPAHMYLARYPPVPLNAFTGNRYYIFGWKISMEKMFKLAEQIKIAECDNYTAFLGPPYYLDYLNKKSGYYRLRLVFGFPEDVEVPEDPRKLGECGRYTGIGISSTRSLRLFWKRPTQAQFERLKVLIGEDNPPMWFKDAMPKDYFEEYGF